MATFQPRTKLKPTTLSSWLLLLLVLQAGDIELNPGPHIPKFPCKICWKAAKWGQKCLQCKLCQGWYHTGCLGMPDSVYDVYENNSSLSWICNEGCGMPQFWKLEP